MEGADLVVLAVPLGAMAAVLEAMGPGLASHAVLTDVGSAKCSVIESACSAFGAVPENFVPAHPIAGTEHSGVEAAVEGLFQGQTFLQPDMDFALRFPDGWETRNLSEAVVGAHRAEPVEDRLRWIVGRRRVLEQPHVASLFIAGVKIRERPADIDADQPSQHALDRSEAELYTRRI